MRSRRSDDLVHALLGEHQRALRRRESTSLAVMTASTSTSQNSAIFSFMSVRQRTLAAAQQNIGLDTDGAQFLHAVLRGLGLQLLRGGDPGDQRHVHEQRVVAAQLVPQLADGFEKRQRFDVADGAADFDDHHVDGCRRGDTLRTAALISLVTCGITCTVLPR